MGNFEFLEKINPHIANLANTAEKLFRDEYFDQCITQTRKMAEVMTRNVLGSKAQEDDTFDDMLYKLKTVSTNNFREKEFISDMYFLKKQGNIAVHSEKSSNDGKLALECLEHAFEASVNYAYAHTHSDKINRLIFDEKLLVLGEKNQTLQEEYKQKLDETKKQKENDVQQSEHKKTKTNFIKPKEKKTLSKQNSKNILSKQQEKNAGWLKKALIIVSFLACSVVTIIFILSHAPNLQLSKPEKIFHPAQIQNKNKIKTTKQNIPNKKYSITNTFSELR